MRLELFDQPDTIDVAPRCAVAYEPLRVEHDQFGGLDIGNLDRRGAAGVDHGSQPRCEPAQPLDDSIVRRAEHDRCDPRR